MKRYLPYAVYFLMIAVSFFLFIRASSAAATSGADAQANATAAGDPPAAQIEKLPDPFLTDEEARFFALQDKNITWTDPNISAIFYSSRSSTVVVQGRVLGVNDFIDGRQIIAIRPEAVVLKDKKGTYVVKMGSVLQQQPSQTAKTD
jgi:hypothetical protein